jgi:hypothetical protein
MPLSVYKVIEPIGTSTTSWEQAARNAVERMPGERRAIGAACSMRSFLDETNSIGLLGAIPAQARVVKSRRDKSILFCRPNGSGVFDANARRTEYASAFFTTSDKPNTSGLRRRSAVNGARYAHVFR